MIKRRILNHCLKIAQSHNSDKLHPEAGCYMHYSFAVWDNQIIDWTTNRRGASQIHNGYANYTKIHAEFDLMRRLRAMQFLYWGFDVVNIRLTKTSLVRNSKPCPACSKQLKRTKCKSVYYTNDDGEFCKFDLEKFSFGTDV